MIEEKDYGPSRIWTPEEREANLAEERGNYQKCRKAGIQDEAFKLSATEIGPFGEALALQFLGGKLNRDPSRVGSDGGRDLFRREDGGRMVAYAIQTRSERKMDFGFRAPSAARFVADRGILCWPLEGDAREGTQIIGYFEAEDIPRFAYLAKGSLSQQLWFPFQELRPIWPLLFEPAEAGEEGENYAREALAVMRAHCKQLEGGKP